MENKYGIDTARAMLKEDRAQAAEFARNTDRPVVDDTQDYMQLLNANSYQKGGWILHMLRRQLGDTVFQRSVRSYYATYAGKNADSKDLETIFEKVSGKDLTVFFRQWLYTGGIPRLNVKWSNAGAKLTLEIKQLQKSLFQFPLEINAITVSGKKISQTINVTTATQTFSLPVKEKIVSIQLDPKVSLLFEGTLSEQK
jgi:aminopeptidase N